MRASLDEVISAFRSGIGVVLSEHYLRERMGLSDRPWPHEIAYGLLEDRPRIVRDDEGLSDTRGAVCDIACEDPGGSEFVIRVNYEKRPMVIVTAFRGSEFGDET